MLDRQSEKNGFNHYNTHILHGQTVREKQVQSLTNILHGQTVRENRVQ